jgi:hypothetical protein
VTPTPSVTPTITRTRTPIPVPPTSTPRKGTVDGGCAVAPAASGSGLWLLVPAVMLGWRRRWRQCGLH